MEPSTVPHNLRTHIYLGALRLGKYDACCTVYISATYNINYIYYLAIPTNHTTAAYVEVNGQRSLQGATSGQNA